MRNSFFTWLVMHFYGNICYRYSHPGCLYNYFYFKLEQVGNQLYILHFPDRIKAVTGLRIFQFNAGFNPEPEIGELVAKTAFTWNILLVHIAGPDDQGILFMLKFIQKKWEV